MPSRPVCFAIKRDSLLHASGCRALAHRRRRGQLRPSCGIDQFIKTIGEIGERIAERRQFPIEHRGDLAARRHARSYCRCGNRRERSRRAPASARFVGSHSISRSIGRDVLRLARRGIALTSGRSGGRNNCRACRNRRARSPRDRTGAAAPAFDLGFVDGAALAWRDARQRAVPKHAALDHRHDVERRADDAVVRAQRVRARHRKAGAPGAPG